MKELGRPDGKSVGIIVGEMETTSVGDADIDVVGSIDGFADGPSEPTRLGIVLGA